MSAADFLDEDQGPESKPVPTLAQVIREAIESRLVDLRVSMPAKVVAYDHKKQLADVQPLFRKKYPDGQVLDPPRIYNVPVGHPRAGNAFIHLPIKAGDTVQLVVMDQSNDKWLDNGEMVDPEDARAHNLSDCWAYPGGSAKNKAFSPANGDDVIIKNGKGEVRIREDGKFQVLGSGDLVGAIHDLAIATQAVASVVDSNHGGGTASQVGQAANKIGNFKA